MCREMIPAGSVFAFLAEHRRRLFPPETFADMYAPVNGRPSVPPELLATVVVLQTLHGLSDEEAVGALPFDLWWKAACGLGLYDQGFDPSLLTSFRRRLARSPDPNRIFAIVRTVVEQTGVPAGRTRRTLDSAVLVDAVATQDEGFPVSVDTDFRRQTSGYLPSSRSRSGSAGRDASAAGPCCSG
ncbi:transposase [Nonomuraea ceibae]|uniref:transposase n=1 Tax=Nonomuraea ceibae TaxID=1935170 RepID=UPI001C5FB861|nr:transposase [Nonomuraea ceibae]